MAGEKKKQNLTGYAKTISEATGYTDPAALDLIEDCMRRDIFHSTLDWQTRKQLEEAARLAVAVLTMSASETAKIITGAA